MKMRWAAALLLLTGLCANRAWADGFGFTVANATVVNTKAAGNTNINLAEVGDTFAVTDAPFASYRSVGAAPAINDNDLFRYTASLAGTATEVTGNLVHYTGTFSITYRGSETHTIVTGKLDLRATYSGTAAIIKGFLIADPKLVLPAPWDQTDFSLYNPGRFFGVYQPTAGDPTHGTVTANASAGNVGFAASIESSTCHNQKAAGNTDTSHAEVGDTFTITTPILSYYTLGGPPLTDNDLALYSMDIAATVTDVTGTLVTYKGTFTLKYNGAAFPGGIVIETGNVSLKASYNESFTGSAKLTGEVIAKDGMETNQAPFGNTDFAIFNPASFSGTYSPTGDGTTGTVSGSLYGGVLGFCASVADGVVINTKADGNTHADYAEVGDTFHATGPLAAYLAVGAPPLLDRDLNRYTVIFDGTVMSVTGTTVVYQGTFRITYAGGAISTSIETGKFEITAVYNSSGNAKMSGTLTATVGPESTVGVFQQTDYSAFNPAQFSGWYIRVNQQSGTFRGSLLGGTMAEGIQSRLLGPSIEGSATAAILTDDSRRAIVASGSKLFVLDPATGDDVTGWEGGKDLDGKVIGRSAVLKDNVFVGTDTGFVYNFNLKTGAMVASARLDPNAKIYSGLAVVDKVTSGDPQDTVVVPVYRADLSKTLIYKISADLLTYMSSELSAGAISTSAPCIPQNGLIYVGTNAGLFTLRYADLSIQSQVNTPTPTSPLCVGSLVYVGTGTGTTFQKLNVVTGQSVSQFELASPLMMSAFYEKKTNLVQAGTADGRIASFDIGGNYLGLTLPGLFNPDVTGGAQTMPVSANNVLYRATENKEILSGKPINGDDQQMIAVLSPVRGAMSVTGQTPGADYLIATSADGLVHMIGVR